MLQSFIIHLHVTPMQLRHNFKEPTFVNDVQQFQDAHRYQHASCNKMYTDLREF